MDKDYFIRNIPDDTKVLQSRRHYARFEVLEDTPYSSCIRIVRNDKEGERDAERGSKASNNQ